MALSAAVRLIVINEIVIQYLNVSDVVSVYLAGIDKKMYQILWIDLTVASDAYEKRRTVSDGSSLAVAFIAAYLFEQIGGYP